MVWSCRWCCAGFRRSVAGCDRLDCGFPTGPSFEQCRTHTISWLWVEWKSVWWNELLYNNCGCFGNCCCKVSQIHQNYGWLFANQRHFQFEPKNAFSEIEEGSQTILIYMLHIGHRLYHTYTCTLKTRICVDSTESSVLEKKTISQKLRHKREFNCVGFLRFPPTLPG